MLAAVLTMVEEKDHPRFEALYHKYVKLMYYIAKQYLPLHEDAEDAVYIALTKIAQHFDKIDDIDCPQTKGFVVVVTENVAKDIIRKSKREVGTKILDDPDDILGYPDSRADPFDLYQENELIRAIRGLDDKYSDVLYLYSVHGYDISDISGILGISKEAAKKRLQRARSMLKKRLENNDA